MKLRYILYLLITLPFLWSCNNEDDIEEIFVKSGTWYVVDYYTKANWDKRNGTPKYNVMAHSSDKATAAAGKAALEIIQKFSLTFKADGTFTGGMQNGSFQGKWQADGDKRTISLNFNGTPNTSTSYNKEFIDALNNAEFYNGDTNYLMLGPGDKKSFIQFAHEK